MTMSSAANKSRWLFSLLLMIFPVFFNSSDRVIGGGVYGAGVWSTEPPFASGPRGGREGGMAEEIKSFLISFGTYLFFTFSWWALKTGFDAGEAIVLVFFWVLIVIVVFFFCFQCTVVYVPGSRMFWRRTAMRSSGPAKLTASSSSSSSSSPSSPFFL